MMSGRPCTFRFRLFVLVAGVVLCGVNARGMGKENDRDILDEGEHWGEAVERPLSITAENWTFSLAGGKSIFNKGATSMRTPDSRVTFIYNNQLFLLSFPGGTYSADNFDDGVAVQAALMRQMSGWISVGLQGGVSFGHNQKLVDGLIPFSTYDSMGNLISSQIITYTVNYRFIIYHAAPMVTLGHYLPIGKFAWKPYVSAGAGIHSVHETVVFNAAGVDLDLSQRTSTAFGVLLGGGVDFRLSPSGALGVQYQAQRVLTGDQDWTLSLPTVRFSYLF